MAEKILEVANSSPAMNIDITGALFTLWIQYDYSQTKCKVGAIDHWSPPVINWGAW